MSAVYLLLGFPGTGKYTVAKALTAELERRGEAVRLVDNHYVNNVIFGVTEKRGTTPPEVWAIIRQVRRAVTTALHDHGNPEWNIVFTNFITTAKVPQLDPVFFPSILALGAQRPGGVRVVRLTCEVEELCRRIQRPDRVARMKMSNPERVRQIAAEDEIYDPPDLPSITLDVTTATPEQTALQILAAWP